jgi:beta-phosphoglucomutase
MTRRAQAILWDMDGVIAHSGPCHYEAYRRLFSELGIEFSREQYFDELFGLRNWHIIRTVAGDRPREEIERLANRKEEMFREAARGKLKALPGARELIAEARRRGLKQAIVSSTPRVNIEMVLAELGLEDAVDTIVGEEDAEKGKPDPEGFLIAAGRLGSEPAGCVVIEDAPGGVEAGKAAGMRVIAVATTRAPQRLKEADLVVESLQDPRVRRFLFGEADGG